MEKEEIINIVRAFDNADYERVKDTCLLDFFKQATNINDNRVAIEILFPIIEELRQGSLLDLISDQEEYEMDIILTETMGI